MGICPTLDFQWNFPLFQLLNIRTFSPQRNCLFNPHFLGNWTGNGFFMAENGAGSLTAANPRPRGSSLCPLNMKLMPIFPVGCQMQTLVFLIAPFPPQSAREEPTKQSSSGNSFLQSEAPACLWDEGKHLLLTGYSSHLQNNASMKLN